MRIRYKLKLRPLQLEKRLGDGETGQTGTPQGIIFILIIAMLIDRRKYQVAEVIASAVNRVTHAKIYEYLRVTLKAWCHSDGHNISTTADNGPKEERIGSKIAKWLGITWKTNVSVLCWNLAADIFQLVWGMDQEDQAKGLVDVTYWWDTWDEKVLRVVPEQKVNTLVLVKPVVFKLPVSNLPVLSEPNLPVLVTNPPRELAVYDSFFDFPAPRVPYWRRILAFGFGLAGILLFTLSNVAGRDEIQVLKELQDIDGLHKLNIVEERHAVSKEQREAIFAPILAAGFTNVRLKDAVYEVRPLEKKVAKAISEIDRTVVNLKDDNLVAVLGSLQQPMWIVADGGYQGIKHGTWIDTEDDIGFVTHIDHREVSYMTLDRERTFTRDAYALMDIIYEQPGDKNVFYAREGGNLEPLLEFLGLDIRLDLAGQITGFFQPLENLDDLKFMLTEVANQDVPFHVGYYATKISYLTHGAKLMEHFQGISPVPITWDKGQLHDEILFSGFSLSEVAKICGQTIWVENETIVIGEPQ